MKIAVKKNILLKLLKNINENRTNDYSDLMGGKIINPTMINTFSDDEFSPIKPTSQMATQLSVSAPPVHDEDYIPGTKEELASSAAFISKEVPFSQIEYFYRQLHYLLDKCLDKEENLKLNLNEVIDITKRTTFDNLNLIIESEQPSSTPFKDYLKKHNPGYDDHIENLDDDEQEADYNSGYELALQLEDYLVMLENDEISEEEFDRQADAFDIIVKTGSIKFQEGYADGIRAAEIDRSMPAMEDALKDFHTRDFPSKDSKDNDPADVFLYPTWDAYMTRSNLTDDQKNDIYLNLILDSHLIVQELSQNLENEYTKAMQMFYANKDVFNSLSKSYIDSMIKPTQAKLGMSNYMALTPLRVQEKMKTSSKDEQKRLMSFFEKGAEIMNVIRQMLYLKYTESDQYSGLIDKYAANKSLTSEKVIGMISEELAEDYATYGRSGKFDPVEQKAKYIQIEVRKSMNIVFKSFVESKGTTNLKNVMKTMADKGVTDVSGKKVSDVMSDQSGVMPWAVSSDISFINMKMIIKILTPEDFDQFKEAVLTDLDSRLRDGDGYAVYDQGEKIEYSEEEFLSIFEREMRELEIKVLERHGIPTDEIGETMYGDNALSDVMDEIDIDKNDEINTVQEMERQRRLKLELEKQLKQFEQGRDYSFLAPYFGYSGASGLRQWFLRYPDRKFSMLMKKDPNTGEYPFVNAVDSIYLKMIATTINTIKDDIIPSIEKRLLKNKGKQQETDKKGGIKSLSDQMSKELFMNALNNLSQLAAGIDQKSLAEVIDDNPALMNSIGGQLIRNVVGTILDDVINTMNNDMTKEIAYSILDFSDEKNLKIDETAAAWATQYFTGLIDRPFKGNGKNEIYTKPDKLIQVGINTAEDYYKIEKIVEEIMTGYIIRHFGIRYGKGGVEIPGKYLKLINEKIKRLKTNSTAIEKAINDSLVQYVDEKRLDDLMKSDKQNVKNSIKKL